MPPYRRDFAAFFWTCSADKFPIWHARKHPFPYNFSALAVFLSGGTRINARRRLCDAKTQNTIPGAQSPSPYRKRVAQTCWRGGLVSIYVFNLLPRHLCITILPDKS